MSKEAMKLALETLENQRTFIIRPDHEGRELTPTQVTNAITALREALAEQSAQQEPVASQPCPTCEALARTVMLDQTAHDAQRTWVGLTDEERYLGDARSEEEIEYARAIESKLKDKNI